LLKIPIWNQPGGGNVYNDAPFWYTKDGTGAPDVTYKPDVTYIPAVSDIPEEDYTLTT
jgi:hypothetical protein